MFVLERNFKKMHRKTKDVRRKGKDKAREHFEKCGKYDGKSVRRVEAYLEKAKLQKDIDLAHSRRHSDFKNTKWYKR